MVVSHRTIRVHGRVQGVFFRVAAQKQADILGLHGYAKNEEDGTVLIEAEGSSDALMAFERWCHHGPMFANVERVEVTEGEFHNLRDFTVR